jgi:D-inositol-3-phosphate glycosyltransferase
MKGAQISLLTAGRDKHYALGLAMALAAAGVKIDFIGSDDLDSPELRGNPQINFLNLRGDQSIDAGLLQKMARVLIYYLRLIFYAATARPKSFHILWNNKFETFDRTALMLYYKLLGKKIVFTAHNVNAGARDANDSWLNRATLKFQYRLCDHIFVHTEKMKGELVSGFGVSGNKLSVIPFGVNSTVPDTTLTGVGARERLGLTTEQKVVLFFGMIAPYKGLEYLVEAMVMVIRSDPSYRLVIAGQPKNCAVYWEAIKRRVACLDLQNFVIQRIEFLPDADIEIYFKAADVLVLPYTYIFQSGVLLLGYNFGLPVIATDVGSLKEDIVEGETGFVCRPADSADLARTLETYFACNLYHRLERHRKHIRAFAVDRYSWVKVGEVTRAIYTRLLTRTRI